MQREIKAGFKISLELKKKWNITYTEHSSERKTSW